ncbi:MAG: LexA family transcriptional regulator [Nitrospinota bacterium]|jgi:transcriptional regulator with XRE-family HTH domain|nr:LexA family transcriptional regulator [Nitrospinota bacterium]MDP7168740.1 LexA family transcriptional regulator [Nitrospinota bacterium]MDP7504793.1 LexA family transcriptional regulator [Nitrospinota bacterium]
MPSDKGFTGKRLRRLREGKNLTRAAVARKAGIDADEIEQIESGGIDPTLGALQRIADSMEVSLADLLSLPPSSIACEMRLVSENESAHQAAGELIPVPVVSGNIAAGNARIVDDAIMVWLFLPKEEFARHSSNLVAVRISGRSMEPELSDDSVAVVDRNDRVVTSDAIFAIRDIDGGCTVKRVEVLDADHVALIPSNRSKF